MIVISPLHQLKPLKEAQNGITLQEKQICLHLTKLPLNCYNITVFDMCLHNKAFYTSFFLTVSPSKIIGTINFDNAREQRYPAEK